MVPRGQVVGLQGPPRGSQGVKGDIRGPEVSSRRQGCSRGSRGTFRGAQRIKEDVRGMSRGSQGIKGEVLGRLQILLSVFFW